MPWEDRQWSDQDWQGNWWSSCRGYRGARGGNPWRASQVRRNWGDFRGSWSSSANQSVPQALPQLPPPPAQQEGHWEVRYTWIPAEATSTAAGNQQPPEPVAPAEPAETEAVEEEPKKEEGEWKEEWAEGKEELDWEEEEEDHSWGDWKPEVAKPVPIPSRDESKRSRTPPSRTTHRKAPLLRRAGKQREPERSASPARRKQPRSAIWYGYYDRTPEGVEAGEGQADQLVPQEPQGPPPPWSRGDLEEPSARSATATPVEPSRPTYADLKGIYKGSDEGNLIGSETEAERSGVEEEIYEATEGAYSPGDKRIDLRQQTSAGDLRPRPTHKAFFSPTLSQEEFADRFREQRLAIQRREETEAKQREEERIRIERKKLRGAYNQGSLPGIGVDWHKTLAGDSGRVSSANKALLAELIEAGYRIVIVSFASSRKRQEQVLSGRRALQHVLGHPLRLVLCPRKLSSDGGARESLTGDVVSKAEAILEEQVAVYVDDQAVVLQDVQRSQRHKPRRSQTLCLQASRDPDFSSAPLRDLIRETAPEDLPVIH